MNDIVVLVIIWIVITLLNQVFKKSKQQTDKAPQKPTIPQRPRQQADIPPIMKKLLDLEERPEPEPQFEMESEEEPEPLPIPDSIISETRIEELPAEPSIEKSFLEVQGKKMIRSRKIKRKQIKQAIIWKEILDRPVSLRQPRRI